VASIGTVRVHVHTRVTSSPVRGEVHAEWHDDGWRCRIGAQVYRVSGWFARIADRIDAPKVHPRGATYAVCDVCDSRLLVEPGQSAIIEHHDDGSHTYAPFGEVSG
jgi:hypothetical protein